jgi:hypothetical protein
MDKKDLEFCDGCEFRGKAIQGTYCARTAMDNMARVSSLEVFSLDSGTVLSGPEAAQGPAQVLYDEALVCIAVVRNGGQPIL